MYNNMEASNKAMAPISEPTFNLSWILYVQNT
jgi:hypothetical protein